MMILRRLTIAFAGLFLLPALSCPVMAQSNSNGQSVSTPKPSTPGYPGSKQKNKNPCLKPGNPGFSKTIKKLPSDFPGPVYPGSVAEGANEIEGPGRSFFGRFRVAADQDQVASWYESTFKTGGWSLSTRPSKDPLGAIRMVALKGQNIGCTVRLEREVDSEAKLKKRTHKYVDTTKIGIAVNIK